MAQLIATATITVCLIAAYVAVTIAGNDGTALLGILGGYLGGIGVHVSVAQARAG